MKGLAIRPFVMEDTDAVLALWRESGIARWDPNLRLTIQKKFGLLRQQGCIKLKLQLEEQGKDAVEFYRKLGYAVQPLISMSKMLVGPEKG